MKITTLWMPGEGGFMPWLLDSYDEYIFEDGEVPPFYREKQERYLEARELVIEVPDGAVEGLFEVPIVKGDSK